MFFIEGAEGLVVPWMSQLFTDSLNLNVILAKCGIRIIHNLVIFSKCLIRLEIK